VLAAGRSDGLALGIATVRTAAGPEPFETSATIASNTAAAAARAMGCHEDHKADQPVARSMRSAIPGHRSRGGATPRGRAAA
jgi:hypothetical protein